MKSLQNEIAANIAPDEHKATSVHCTYNTTEQIIRDGWIYRSYRDISARIVSAFLMSVFSTN